MYILLFDSVYSTHDVYTSKMQKKTKFEYSICISYNEIIVGTHISLFTSCSADLHNPWHTFSISIWEYPITWCPTLTKAFPRPVILYAQFSIACSAPVADQKNGVGEEGRGVAIWGG